ncbi:MULTISPECIES: DUF6243 family protein [unclassified Streptomyces]|uniref:DUF6243 family protein n=1 Tax=unclassified Streptomyces TaxID=2593676 RepID=UPI00070188E1|nr:MULTISPECIES: DUF6243 family protein [unclassified Streptomyces]KQX53023.1 hypothetical protein ASD33_07270 [Streptomyces sp. Root1304]KRA89943.1 hypothetical protein ASE09_07280 [Streptomyces sp. Root66D1]
MSKSRNNLLGVGGQRKKLSRADQHGAGQGRTAAQSSADDRKQELLKKMRERAQAAAENTTGPAAESADAAAESTQAADTADTAADTGRQ